jgi:electron transfer flavoprotein alpha subunit
LPNTTTRAEATRPVAKALTAAGPGRRRARAGRRQGRQGAAEAAAKLDGVAKVLLADDARLCATWLAEPLAALIVSLAGGYDAIIAPATTSARTSCRASPRCST